MSDAYDLPEVAQAAAFSLDEEIKQRAVRHLVHRSQRISASGIYGGDYLHPSLWDEFCREQQNGLYFDEGVWGETLEGLLQAEVEPLTPSEFEIIWLASLPKVEDLKNALRFQDDVRREVRSALEALASTETLDALRFAND
jgi:hypothetical protein